MTAEPTSIPPNTGPVERVESDPDEDAGRVIDRDVACASCGYNLRGLAPDGRCPECGAPIANSLRGNTLSSCDPRWLGRLRLGADLIRVGMIVSVGLVLAVVITSGMPPLRTWILLAFQVIATGLMIAGTWLLTLPEIREDSKSPGAKARWRCRGMLFAVLALDVYLIIIVLVHATGFWWLLALRLLAGLVWIGLLTVHIRYLSIRADSGGLRRSCRTNLLVIKGLAALLVIVAAFDRFRDVVYDLVRWLPLTGQTENYVEAFLLLILFSSLYAGLPLLTIVMLWVSWWMLGDCGKAAREGILAASATWVISQADSEQERRGG